MNLVICVGDWSFEDNDVTYDASDKQSGRRFRGPVAFSWSKPLDPSVVLSLSVKVRKKSHNQVDFNLVIRGNGGK